MRVVLVSTYELGHQPFGLASPAAWLRQAAVEVTCLDLAVQRLDEGAVGRADLVAFYLPMHTATRPGRTSHRAGQTAEIRAHTWRATDYMRQ